MYSCATPSESMASLHGRKMDALLQSVSVIVSIVSYSPDGGNFVMKSIAIVSKGLAFSSGVMGESGGWVGCVLTLFIWHVAQLRIYSVTKVFMLGHQ